MRKIDYPTKLGDPMPYAPNINRVGNDGLHPDRCREISHRPNFHLLVFAVIHHALFGLFGKSIGYAGLALLPRAIPLLSELGEYDGIGQKMRMNMWLMDHI